MTDSTDTDRLAQITARVEAASDGPWVTGGTDRNGNRWVGNPDPDDGGPVATAGDDDAEFIAHARADVPHLLSLVEHLQGQLAQTRRQQIALARAFRAESEREGQRAGAFQWTKSHSAAHAEGVARGTVDALQFLLMELGEVEYDEAAETTWDVVMGGGPTMSADTTDGRFWSMTANDDGTVTATFDAHGFTTTPRREDEIADAARPVHYREAAAFLRSIADENGLRHAADILDNTAKDLEATES